MADTRLRFYPLTAIKRISETEDTASFVLELPDNLNEIFAYKAGQFVTFQIPWGDLAIQRCYSLSSSPLLDRGLKFTVKRVAEGRASNWFNDAIEVGTQVMVAPPSGRFQLRKKMTVLWFSLPVAAV